jgi:hypothetical protein
VLFNPYTGEPRDVRDVQSDPQGILILPPGRVEMLAAPQAQTPVPPRLKAETFKELAERCDEGQEGAEYLVAYGRATETLVRKQAGWE